jgi:hypothetical protein
LNGTTVLEFDMPEAARTGRETTAYTFRMMSGFNPRPFPDDLTRLCEPTLVLVGSNDEAFVADAFPAVFADHASHARVESVPGAGHLELVAHPNTAPRSIAWLRELEAGSASGRCR